MCETLSDMFCSVVADEYVVNCCLQYTVMKGVQWALGEGRK